MDNTMLNNLTLYRTKYFSGLVDSRMLANALATEPHKVSPVISYIFGAYDRGNTIDYITNGIGRTMTIESNSYRWDVMIDHDRAIEIKAAKWNGATISSTDVPGIAKSTIQLWLDDRWFGPGAILAFDDKEFMVRVVGEPYQDGASFVYTVVTADGKDESYIPPSLLASGKKVSRMGSAYGEYSEEADIVNYMAPFKMENYLTTCRLSYDITGDAFASVMVIEIRDPKSRKTTQYWSTYQEWVAMRQWYERLDRMMVYQKSSVDSNGQVGLFDSNGRPIYIGAGLLEQMSPANIRYYSSLSIDLVDSLLFDLSYNVLGKGERKFLALAGEMAMREWHRVLKDESSGYTLIDTKFISGTGQELVLGGQFVTYRGLNGIEITFKHLPIFDDPIHNRKLHPVSGKPLESYRVMILWNGYIDGEPNVQKVVRKGREMVMWHTAGAVAPGAGFATSINTLRSNAKDGYSVHFLSEQGIMVKDPTACAQLICDAE